MEDTIQAKEFLTTKVKEWTTAVGLPAVVLLTRGAFHCGYVGVPQNHPLYGMAYNTRIKRPQWIEEAAVGKRGIIDILVESFRNDETCHVGILFDVHGGITYSDKGEGSYGGFLSAEYWWFGYDCAHAGDEVRSAFRGAYSSGRWRDEKYCTYDCAHAGDEVRSAFRGAYSSGRWRDEKYCTDECESLATQLKALEGMVVEKVAEEIEE